MLPRDIPSIEQLRQRPESAALEARYGRDAVTSALRDAAEALRARLGKETAAAAGSGPPGGAAAGNPPAFAPAGSREPDGDRPRQKGEAVAWLLDRAAQQLAALRPSLRPVVNATGVIVHTNLGRAPLAPAAIDAIARVAAGYSNLEYDLDAGSRGTRDRHAERLLCRLTGAEAALVVNNNAAATMLLLAGLARGREVVVSRGELVEIGGGFRVPDVMAQSGAVLREVGTTNRTRVADYAAAVNEKTALILRVHPSNFRIEGFTERPTLEALVTLGRQLGVPVAEDQGSGNLLRLGASADAARDHPLGPPHVDQASIVESIAAGADLVCCSGDKLLGGPQSGLVLGRRTHVDALRRHPLMRAFRVDKLTYSALEATLMEYAVDRALTTVPVLAMLALTAGALRERAEALCASVAARHAARDRRPGLTLSVEPDVSTIGGGSAPGSTLPTWVIAITGEGGRAEVIEAALRASDPPIVARIAEGRVVLDLRTVLPEQDAVVAAALEQIDSFR